MATSTERMARTRESLTRDRVLRAAMSMADREGVESISMRRLAQGLGVVPMALYKHVANKDELLDGMTELVMTEINAAAGPSDLGTAHWKSVMRRRVLSARAVLLRHPWAPRVMESRADLSPATIRYYDDTVGLFRAGGFSTDLTHHALHVMGSRALGFTQELYDDSRQADPGATTALLEQMAGQYPNISAMVAEIAHEAGTTLGWCDDQAEFEFALDLILDGLERLRDEAGSVRPKPSRSP